MAEMKSKIAFGTSANIESALEQNIIDAYDVLLLDGDTEPKVGWIDKNGNVVICEDKEQVVSVDVLPESDGKTGVVYLFENKGYVWDNEQNKCIPLSESADVSELTTKVSDLETQIGEKISAEEVDQKIEEKLTGISAAIEIVEF